MLPPVILIIICTIPLFSEHTCFDGRLSSDHETDVDCGGEFCEACNISQVCSMIDCVVYVQTIERFYSSPHISLTEIYLLMSMFKMSIIFTIPLLQQLWQ